MLPEILPEHEQFLSLSGEMMFAANLVILNPQLFLNRDLNVTDVKWYLDRESTSVQILRQAYQKSPFLSQFDEGAKMKLEALNNWDTDRTRCLFYLLYDLQIAVEDGRMGSAGAYEICCKLLTEEPLIPNKEFMKYRQALIIAEVSLRSAIAKKSPNTNIWYAYEAGIVHNINMFCPALFKEKTYGGHIRQSRKMFYDYIDKLFLKETS
jgi:hypothetical protein